MYLTFFEVAAERGACELLRAHYWHNGIANSSVESEHVMVVVHRELSQGTCEKCDATTGTTVSSMKAGSASNPVGSKMMMPARRTRSRTVVRM